VADARPNLDDAFEALVGHICASNADAFGHIDAGHLLFVAGAARREARASIRPLTFGGQPPSHVSPDGQWRKPRVIVRGVPQLYEVCLRPQFFLNASPRQRLRTIVHELWHISEAFDGSLDPQRRHRQGHDDSMTIEAMADAVENTNADLSILAVSGEAIMRAWRCRPPSRIPADTDMRTRYGDDDLFAAVVVTSSCP
jgi:hypothetical protein